MYSLSLPPSKVQATFKQEDCHVSEGRVKPRLNYAERMPVHDLKESKQLKKYTLTVRVERQSDLENKQRLTRFRVSLLLYLVLFFFRVEQFLL